MCEDVYVCTFLNPGGGYAGLGGQHETAYQKVRPTCTGPSMHARSTPSMKSGSCVLALSLSTLVTKETPITGEGTTGNVIFSTKMQLMFVF